jgi:hypothetical protein
MREYPDPEQYLEGHIERSVAKYARGLRQAGLEPNHTLTKALAERACEEAKENYTREAKKVLDHNIGLVIKDHRRRMNKIKRQGATLRLWLCPLLAACGGLMAWYSFSQGDFTQGIVYAAGGLAFLAMLVFGAIFDRPR